MSDSTLGSLQKQSQLLAQMMAIGQAIQQHITHNPQKVYQLIAETTCQATGADCVVIYPYHPAFGEFYDSENIATCGLRYDLELEEQSDKKKRLEARVHRKGEVIHEDILGEDPQSRFISREAIRAYMGLSLRLDGDVVGILYVDYRQPHHFSQEEKALIRLFGQQAAIAISHSWRALLADIRKETVAKLKQVGQTLLAIGDPTRQLPGVLQEIANSASEVLDADIVDLYQYIQARDEVILPPIMAGDRYSQVTKETVYADDVVLRVVKAGDAQYFEDAQETALLTGAFEVERADKPENRFVVRERLASSAVLPLVAAAETVGVMFVNYRTRQLFGPQQRDIIESFATQAATAIYNARLTGLEQKQRQLSDTLREVGQIVSSTLELKEVSGLILEQLAKVFEYNSASVQIIRGDHRSLLSARGFLQNSLSDRLLRNVSEDRLVSKIVKERDPVVLTNVADEPLWERFPETEAIQSWIGVPLVVRDQVIGLLTIDHHQAGHFRPEDGPVAAAFASQVALAVRNAELYSVQQRRNRDLQVLNQSAINLGQKLDPKEAYQTLLNAAIDTLACDYCTIFLAQADNTLVSYISDGILFDRPPKIRFQPGEGLAGLVYQSGQPMLVPNTATDSRYKPRPSEKVIQPRSIILAPLRQGDKTIGVISADIGRPDAFDENDLRVLETLTQHAGTVLQNIEFISDFQTLHDVVSGLSQQPLLQKVYERVVDAVLETFRCQHNTIFILDRTAGELVAMARTGSDQPASMVRRFKPGEGLAGTVLQTGQPMLITDAAGDERFVEGGVAPRSAPRSIILAPIKIEDELIGVISADKDERNGFSRHNLDMLETLALDVGIAIQVRRQQDMLQAIANFQQAISNILPVREQLQQIYENMSGLMDASSMFIALYDQDTSLIQFPLVYERGRLIGEAEKIEGQPYSPRTLGSQRGLTEWVIQHQELLFVENFAGWRPAKGEVEPGFLAEIKCCLLVPACLQDRIVGVIGLQNFDQPYVFDRSHRELLATIASQAAIAIDNARLHEQMGEQVDRLSTLYEIGKKITAQESAGILEDIAEDVVQLVGARRSLFLLVDDEQKNLVKVSGHNYPQEHLDSITYDEVMAGVSGWVLEHKQPVRVADALSDPRNTGVALEKAAQADSRALIVAPLMVRGKARGTLTAVNTIGDPPFSPDDLSLVVMLADQAAIALDNARLYQDLERQVEALSTLNEVSRELTAGLRLTEAKILELIYEQAQELTDARDMYIALYDEATNILRFALATEKGQRVDIASRQANMERRGMTEEIIRTGQPLLHRTFEESKIWYEQPEHQEHIGKISNSWLGVPMMLGEKVLGVIALWDWEQEYAYDELDVQVLSAMAGQAAIALDNANLFYHVNRDLERRVEALSALNQVGQALTAGIRLEEDQVLELIYEQAQKLTGTQDAYIALYDQQTGTIRFPLATEKERRVEYPSRQANMERRGKTEELIFTRKPLLQRTEEESKAWYKEPAHEEFVGRVPQSWLGVPMTLGAKVLGVIAVYDWQKEHAYDDLDLQVLSAMADEAAIALDNASLLGRLEQRLDQFQMVQQITAAFKTYAELDDLLKSILEVALPRLNAQVGTIQLLDPVTEELISRAVVGTVEQSQYGRLVLGQGITGQAAQEKRSIYVADTLQDKRFLDYLGRMRSELAIPLQVEDRVIGVFNIEDPRADAFDPPTRELAELVAGQVAVVIQNGQRREELLANRELTAVGTATAAIQHRINNTLNIIRPNLSSLRRRVDTANPKIAEILDLIERNVQYTSDYIQRIQEPLKDKEVGVVDVNASLREAHSQVRQQAQEQPGLGPVEADYNLDESLPLLEASMGQLTEVFRNLIENAYKAMGEQGGRLTVTSRRTDGWIEMEIRDTGPGIPENIRSRIFQKPVPSKQPGQGSGLGLWLTRLLLQKNGGEIKIKETGPDGTTMLVRLNRTRT